MDTFQGRSLECQCFVTDRVKAVTCKLKEKIHLLHFVDSWCEGTAVYTVAAITQRDNEPSLFRRSVRIKLLHAWQVFDPSDLKLSFLIASTAL